MISVPEAAQLPSVPRPMRSLEFLHHVGRKSMREERERLRQMNADHFPVAGGGVLARRRERAFSECRAGPIHGTDMRQRFQIAQAQPRQIRQMQLPHGSDVAQRVAPRVSISGRVRHFARSDAIQHDPGDAREWRRHW